MPLPDAARSAGSCAFQGAATSASRRNPLPARAKRGKLRSRRRLRQRGGTGPPGRPAHRLGQAGAAVAGQMNSGGTVASPTTACRAGRPRAGRSTEHPDLDAISHGGWGRYPRTDSAGTRQDVCGPRRLMTVDSDCAGLDVVRDDLQRRHCEPSCTRTRRRAQALGPGRDRPRTAAGPPLQTDCQPGFAVPGGASAGPCGVSVRKAREPRAVRTGLSTPEPAASRRGQPRSAVLPG